ncbi:MAG: glycosyltransferase [Candidatus Bipolaricaulis anaerobius]|jgi:chlorobactene glucosyltransferase|nr:glycosyltransferase [Candidatus Bipolaricaulis sp.]MDD3748509.1 glycosyltransferase [Candidatus Bipolaricaulis anaerobius]MDD5764561.1 glycosyltransferase [Candidatus Bipolaricaulis anaerobius]
MSFFVSHEWSLAVFMAVLAGISLTNLVAMRRLGRHPPLSKYPAVSILVPARDEERNIEACVESLLRQDYPQFEVIVLDDDSHDGTWALLQEIAARSGGRVRVLAGEPVPAGWLGKHWACHQLAQAAQSELLLFTDADTVHHPLALRDAVGALHAERAGVLSVLPRQAVGSWGERLVIPVLAWVIHTFVPFILPRRIPTAVGQFMLFRRGTYEAVGGHAAIRSEVVDDLALARNVHRAGLGWAFLDGSGRVTTRMYQGWNEAARGLAKNLFPVFRYNVPLYLFVWTWLLWLACQPPLVLILNAVGGRVAEGMIVPAAATIGLSLVTWVLSAVRFRLPLAQVLLYPVTILLVFGIALRSLLWHLRGRGTWKGREIHVEHDPR